MFINQGPFERRKLFSLNSTQSKGLHGQFELSEAGSFLEIFKGLSNQVLLSGPQDN